MLFVCSMCKCVYVCVCGTGKSLDWGLVKASQTGSANNRKATAEKIKQHIEHLLCSMSARLRTVNIWIIWCSQIAQCVTIFFFCRMRFILAPFYQTAACQSHRCHSHSSTLLSKRIKNWWSLTARLLSAPAPLLLPLCPSTERSQSLLRSNFSAVSMSPSSLLVSLPPFFPVTKLAVSLSICWFFLQRPCTCSHLLSCWPPLSPSLISLSVSLPLRSVRCCQCRSWLS